MIIYIPIYLANGCFENMYSNLLTHINRFVKLSAEEEDMLSSYLNLAVLKKKEYLLEEGKICTANYFIQKGCFRTYFINEKGTEQILQFGIENWWITDYTSLESQSPSNFFIQAIENAEIVVLEKNIQEILFQKIPKLERYFRIILQKSYSASQLRIKYIFSLSGEERYHHFNNSFPEFVQRIPQYMLASYLGFSPEFLSKIRANKLS